MVVPLTSLQCFRARALHIETLLIGCPPTKFLVKLELRWIWEYVGGPLLPLVDLSASYLGWRTLRAQRPSGKQQLSAPGFIVADSGLEVCLVSRVLA